MTQSPLFSRHLAYRPVFSLRRLIIGAHRAVVRPDAPSRSRQRGDGVGRSYITVRINSINDSYIYVRHCPSDCHSSKEGMTTGVK